jgi:hypothetical protein
MSDAIEEIRKRYNFRNLSHGLVVAEHADAQTAADLALLVVAVDALRARAEKAEKELDEAESRGFERGRAGERCDADLGRTVRNALGSGGARTVWYAVHAVAEMRQQSIDKHGGSVGSAMVVMSCDDAMVALRALAEAVNADALAAKLEGGPDGSIR